MRRNSAERLFALLNPSGVWRDLPREIQARYEEVLRAQIALEDLAYVEGFEAGFDDGVVAGFDQGLSKLTKACCWDVGALKGVS